MEEVKSIRENYSLTDYRLRFKASVYGPYHWKEDDDSEGITPEKHMVKQKFKGIIFREKFGITRSQREKAQKDFETRIKGMILLALENECFSRQKARIIEDVLRFARYLWLNVNKSGRTVEYLILAIMHYVYTLVNKGEENPELREPFPLQRFWWRLAPNRKFNPETYEKNVDFILEAFQTARFKNPAAFKIMMRNLVV